MFEETHDIGGRIAMSNKETINYDLIAITENVLELSKLSYEAEEQREQSLINQSSQMATAFSVISAVILMLFPIITDTYLDMPLRSLTIMGAIIMGLLILSLGTALLVQWRFQYQALPSPQKILEHELQNANHFNTPEQRNKAFVETLDARWKSKREINDLRALLIRISMVLFFVALILLLGSIICATIAFLKK